MPPITIRDVPNEVLRELAGRAARCGRSLEDYLRAELAELAAKSEVGDAVSRIRSRARAAGRTFTAEDIIADRDAERR